ncbi:MAG TPA: hypothetical protein VGI52_00040 [Solirubrobacteraceae bacterium]
MFSFFAFPGFHRRTLFGSLLGGHFRFFMLAPFDSFFGDLFAGFDQPRRRRTDGVRARARSAEGKDGERDECDYTNPHIRIQVDLSSL